MWVIAPSGLGKSTFSFQAAILWSIGNPAFGITSHQPRRTLIIQAEDDEGDCIEMSLMLHELGLSEDEKVLVDLNTAVIHCNDLSGQPFIEALSTALREAREAGAPFALVIINPYSVYQGGDVSSPVDNTRFLNHWLNPVLSEFEIAAILIHHTPKTNFASFDKFQPWDFQYAGAGSANMTNWARAIMVIVPQKVERLFSFVAAKRGARLSEDWNGNTTRLFSWSLYPEVSKWIDPSEEQRGKKVDSDKQKANPNYRPPSEEVFKKCLSLIEWRDFIQTQEAVVKIWPGYGEKLLRNVLSSGVQRGLLELSKEKGTTKPFHLWRRSGTH